MKYTSAYNGIKEERFDNDTKEIAKKYIQNIEICTGYLGYRDLPEIISKHVRGHLALDYGCGPGYSTNLLRELDFQVIGADISDIMLDEARNLYPDIQFVKAENGKTPFTNRKFDLVLSTFVLFDIPSIADVISYFREVKRILKPEGTFIACTGSEFYHLNNWLTEKNEIVKNRDLKSGQIYRVHLTGYDIYFSDFFYSHDDYVKAIRESGLIFKELIHPLGRVSDNIAWDTEWTIPPYSIYVCSTPE